MQSKSSLKSYIIIVKYYIHPPLIGGNLKIGFFQVIYTKYKTSTNKDRVKKQFIFLDEVENISSLELIKTCQETHKRYKNYNNVITLDYDIKNNGYIFNKSKNVTLLLSTTKGTLQDGEKIEVVFE